MTNILIIDDHEIVKEGVESRIANVFTSATCFFTDGLRNAVRILNEKQIDLVLCDLEFKNSTTNTGFSIAEKFLKLKPCIKLIAHTNYNSYRIMNKAMESGFHSFLHKGASFKEFSETITNVLKSNDVYKSETMKNLYKNRKQFIYNIFSDSLYGVSSLSEKQVHLVLLSKETTDRQKLATIMGVNPSTIDTYFKRIMQKLDLNDRKEIGMFANEFYDEIIKLKNS